MRRENPPDAGDETGWAAVVADGRLGEMPPGRLVEALQKLHRSGTPRVAEALIVHLSDLVTRRLRRLIGTDHPNRGEDIIERAHGMLMIAMLDPTSEDGAGLRDAFWARVRFRGIDAARAEMLHRRRHADLVTDDEGEPMIAAARRMDAGPASIEVSQALLSIKDPRKRLAFRLYVEGMRVRAGSPCIAEVVGCDPKTAARWIDEARSLLSKTGIGG